VRLTLFRFDAPLSSFLIPQGVKMAALTDLKISLDLRRSVFLPRHDLNVFWVM